MSTKTKEGTNERSLDYVKWLFVGVLLLVGVVGNSYFGEVGLLYRFIALLVLGAVAVAVALQTAQGAQLWGVLKLSQVEIRKVVWPSRQETNQTTLVVVALTVFMAFVLWGLDASIGWLASLIIG